MAEPSKPARARNPRANISESIDRLADTAEALRASMTSGDKPPSPEMQMAMMAMTLAQSVVDLLEHQMQPPPPRQPIAEELPDPSVPVSLNEAARKIGGDMTAEKLARLCRSGHVRHQRIDRTTYVFSRQDYPNLDAPK